MTPEEINNTFYKSIPRRIKSAYNRRFLLEHFLGFKVFMPYIKKLNIKNSERIKTHLTSFSENLIDVPILDEDTDPNEIRLKYIEKGMPFVIRKGAKSWKAFKKWDFDFFRNEYGDHPVLLSNHKDLGEQGQKSELTNLREIINGLDENSMKYARFNPLLDIYPHLQEELDQTWLSKVRRSKIMKHHVLFIGNKGTKTTVHCAGNENIFVHMKGSKKWFLWDQRAYPILNPDVNRGPAKASEYNPFDVNPEDAFAKIPRYEVVCEEGDIIYIPSYLWHFVYNETPTIGVGIRWLLPKRTIANGPLFAFLELFNTNPSVFHTLNLRKGLDFNKILMKNKERNKGK